MSNWNNLHVTDKNGGKYWSRIASPMSTQSEINNLKRHLEAAKHHPKQYSFMDIESAVIILNGAPLASTMSKEDEELLDALLN